MYRRRPDLGPAPEDRPAPPERPAVAGPRRQPRQRRHLLACQLAQLGQRPSSVREVCGPIPGTLRSSSSRSPPRQAWPGSPAPIHRPSSRSGRSGRRYAPPGRRRTASVGALAQAVPLRRSRMATSWRRRVQQGLQGAGRSSGRARASGRTASAIVGQHARRRARRSWRAGRWPGRSRGPGRVDDADRQAGLGQGHGQRALQAAGGLQDDQRRAAPGAGRRAAATPSACWAGGRPCRRGGEATSRRALETSMPTKRGPRFHGESSGGVAAGRLPGVAQPCRSGVIRATVRARVRGRPPRRPGCPSALIGQHKRTVAASRPPVETYKARRIRFEPSPLFASASPSPTPSQGRRIRAGTLP